MAVINVSEGRDAGRLASVAGAAGAALLDVHSDPDHNRAVLTLGGAGAEEAARSVAVAAVGSLDVSSHEGVHPRVGAVDVVPFVNLAGGGRPGDHLTDGPLPPALEARDGFAAWAGEALGLPCFLYGPERTLPEIRRRAWRDLGPDRGPSEPHRSAGAACVGARPALVAYNLWLAEPDLTLAREVARSIRGPGVRALGLPVGAAVQVSVNLVDPWRTGPGAVFDAVAARAAVERAELVGLLPAGVLAAEPAHRWAELDLALAKTIEARLEEAGLDGGSPG